VKNFKRLAVALAFPLVFSINIDAQAPSGALADADHPSGAPGAPDIASVWHVDPISGSLSVNIPFATTPSGGRGPKIPFGLKYNSSATVTLQTLGMYTEGGSGGDGSQTTCQSFWGGAQSCYVDTPGEPGNIGAERILAYGWRAQPQSLGFGPSGPWVTTGPFVVQGTTSVADQSYTVSTYSGDTETIDTGAGCTILGPSLYTDEPGSTHDMNLEFQNSGTTSGESFPCSNATSLNATTNTTVDGASLQTAISGFSIGDTTVNGAAPSILYPDGTQFYTQNRMLEDSNGNQTTIGADSEGRQAFTTTLPVGAVGLIPAGNYTVMTKGATGNQANYSIQFASVPIGAFSMPHPLNSEIVNAGYCISSVTCPTSFAVSQETDVTPPTVDSTTGVTQITRPDGTQYRFTYDPIYGTISQITFPTGGYVRFEYGVRNIGNTFVGAVQSKSTIVVTDVYLWNGTAGESHWSYSYSDVVSGTSVISTENAPDGTTTSFTGAPFIFSKIYTSGDPTWLEASRTVKDINSTLMKTVKTSYLSASSCQSLPSQITSTLYIGASPVNQQVNLIYDGYCNLIEKDESDRYTGTTPTWLRKTFTTYQYVNSPSWVTAHIVNKPAQVLITDGSGHPYSLVQYGYDASLSGNVGAGVMNHDDVNFGPSSPALPRGNLTTESHCSSVIGTSTVSPNSQGIIPTSVGTSVCSSWLTTSRIYDITGQVQQVTDPKGNITKFDYTDQYGGVAPAKPTNAYPTTITHVANNTTDKYTYNYYIGEQASHSDWNSEQTTYSYIDPTSGSGDSLNRIRQITFPTTVDGTTGTSANQVQKFTYVDTPGQFQVTTSRLVDSGGTSTSTTTNYDALARLSSTSTITPQCPTGVQVQTSYDALSRVAAVTNPFCSTTDPTYGSTQFTYDALGRKVLITYPDTSTSTLAYAGFASQSTEPFNGSTNVRRIQQTDGLGRLTSVCEVSASSLGSGTPSGCGQDVSGTGYLTAYTYDPLGNLLCVEQHGGVTATGCSSSSSSDSSSAWHVRRFTYDGLSRLTSAKNPESGTVSYTYSMQNSSACAGDMKAPCTKTDARGAKTAYSYDGMNRLIGKSYSLASGGSITAVSDLSSCFNYEKTLSGWTDSNPKGEMTAAWEQSGACPAAPVTAIPSGATGIRIFSGHDSLGHVAREQECLSATGCSFSATTGVFNYSYNLMGSTVQSNNGISAGAVGAALTDHQNTSTVTAPSITWKATFDDAGQMQQAFVQDQPSALGISTYLQNPTLLLANGTTAYDPFGHLVSAGIGIPYSSTTPAIQLNRKYDNRARIVTEIDGGDAVSTTATGSVGIITVNGTEAGPFTATATSGSGTLTVSGGDGSNYVCTTTTVYEGGNGQYPVQITTCSWVPDTGTLSVTINGFTSTATYGVGTSDNAIALAIATGFQAASSPVIAVVPNGGNSIGLTAKTTGSVTNYPITLSNGGGFFISDPKATLTGGHAAGTVYDAGTVTVTVTNNSVSPAVNYTTSPVSWSQTSTPSLLAANLVSAINTAAGTIVTAAAGSDPGSINVQSKGTGAGTNYAIKVNVADSQTTAYPSFFPEPSFEVDAQSMFGGGGSGATYGTIYSYGPSGGYAPNGNILEYTDSVIGTWSYTYDGLNRLMSAVPGSNAPTEYTGKRACWTYDALGNRLLEAFSTVACNAGPTPQTVNTYNPANSQLSSSTLSSYTLAANSVGYDAAGDVTFDGNNNYWYDAEGRLCAVQSNRGLGNWQYGYDALGARFVSGTPTTTPAANASCAPPVGAGYTLKKRYLVGLSGDQVTELSEGGTETWVHSNVWMGGRPLGTYDTHGLHFNISDPLGTKRVQSTAQGVIEEYCLSLPYGNDVGNPAAANCVSILNGDATEHHFTAKERDLESGNDYFGARYYVSSMGRFVSPDEIFADQNPSDPRSWNMYVYVRDNPAAYFDPNGQGTAGDIAWGIVSGIGTFVYHSTPIPNAVQAVKDLAHPAAAIARQEAQNKATVSAIKALGSSSGRAALATAAKNTWNNMSTSDKTSLITQTTLGVATAVVGGFAGGGESAASESEILTEGIVYRSGGTNPANLTGEDLSFRTSLSNPIDSSGQPVDGQVVFQPGKPAFGVDVAKLPEGSAVLDNTPPGHVTVNATTEAIKDAVDPATKIKFPK